MDKICLDLHGAVCLQKAWGIGPGRFYPSMFWRKGHGQDLPGSTRCCLLTKSMARRSRQILSFDVFGEKAMDKICVDLHGAVCLQKAWRVGPGRFYPSMFWRKGHGQDLPGSTRCCLLTTNMARRSRQILSFDF